MKLVKPLKAFLFGASGLFIMATLLSLLIPSNIKVSRVDIINAPAGKVYAQIADIRNWKNWHPAFKQEGDKINFAVDGRSCDIINTNRTTHLAITSADSVSVKFILQAKGENDIKNEINITTLPTQPGTQVEWRSFTKLKWYPWEKVYGIFIDKLTGPSYESALKGLKLFLEE